jgi:CcmD family protein
MNPLVYVGAAYAVIWILIFGYAWRLTARSQKLAEKLEEIQRGVRGRQGG